MKVNQIKRQGDVALQMVTVIPSSAVLRTGPMAKIIARGEHSDHSHIVTSQSEVEVFEDKDGTLYVNAKGELSLKHLMESSYMTGNEVWTGEHTEIKFPAGTYKFMPQYEYHPYDDEIRRVMD
jgi:hypothetical protein